MKFAQIYNNKAHWIFEAEETPKFAPNIVLIDITGNEVQEGWDYDVKTNTFVPPKMINISKEVIDIEKVEMAEIIISLEEKIRNLEEK